jgi:hypothetical protein
MEEAIKWWQSATEEEREQFLDKIEAYQVSDHTWYVHPYADEPRPSQTLEVMS